MAGFRVCCNYRRRQAGVFAFARAAAGQADARGDYSQVGAKQEDPGCLFRASLKTDGTGRYAFRTVLPGEYPGRPRHIHYRVSAKGYSTLVTQLYFARERGISPALVVAAVPREGILTAIYDVTLARS